MGRDIRGEDLRWHALLGPPAAVRAMQRWVQSFTTRWGTTSTQPNRPNIVNEKPSQTLGRTDSAVCTFAAGTRSSDYCSSPSRGYKAFVGEANRSVEHGRSAARAAPFVEPLRTLSALIVGRRCSGVRSWPVRQSHLSPVQARTRQLWRNRTGERRAKA